MQTGVSMPCIAQRNRPLLLQGTLTTFRRRCGKPTCRCAAGEPHESPALRFTEDGRTKTLTLTAAELEDELAFRGRELLRRMLQEHLTLRAANEPRLAAVADDAGIVHAVVEAGHRRTLATVFGHVQVERLAYRHRGHQNLHPADAALNLPDERHSH